MIEEATKAEKELMIRYCSSVTGAFPYRIVGPRRTIARLFGTDYFTRTAVAKSNILVNAAAETKYFYQDQDANGERLNGANRYTVTFPKDQTPPVGGFWSLTLYDEHRESDLVRLQFMLAAERQQDAVLRAGTQHSEKLPLRAPGGLSRTSIPEFPSLQSVHGVATAS